jgi:hypothetical protein
MYQMAKIYSKWALNIPTFSILRPSKFNLIGIFDLKIYLLDSLMYIPGI